MSEYQHIGFKPFGGRYHSLLLLLFMPLKLRGRENRASFCGTATDYPESVDAGCRTAFCGGHRGSDGQHWFARVIKLVVPTILLLISTVSGQASSSDADGAQLYREYCASCHGISGDGNGELSYLLYPKPRDFTRRLFKLKTTSQTVPPTHDDLIKTVRDGMPGTGMPSFSFLPGGEIDAIVRFVEGVAGIDAAAERTSVPMRRPIDASVELRELGKVTYAELGCASCHGELGRGDGPTSDLLTDAWGYPIEPKDFTTGYYIGGGRIEDLYYRFVSGMDGTPMPSYEGTIALLGATPEERSRRLWGLIHYVKSLERPAVVSGISPEGGVMTAKLRSSLGGATAFSDRSWNSARRYDIPVSRLWQRDGQNVLNLTVRIQSHGATLAVRLDWDDLTHDGASYKVEDFRDGAAVQFSSDGTPGFHGMGSEKHPAVIWFWRTAPSHGGPFVDDMSAGGNGGGFFPAAAVGNPLLESADRGGGEVVVASGPETAEAALNLMEVDTEARWSDGGWSVIFSGKAPEGSSSADGTIPVAFAVWDGSARDRNGQKMVSTWYRIKMEE